MTAEATDLERAVTPAWARRPANLASALAAELVVRIVRGVHPPGSPLPTEPVLCETFSVSRTVVREAVKMLQEKGLVQVRQGAGTTVNPPTTWDMLDELVLAATIATTTAWSSSTTLSPPGALLESDMANVAARLAGPDIIERLRALVDRMDELVDDHVVYEDHDRAFHDTDHADVRQPHRPRRGAVAGEPGHQHRPLHGRSRTGPRARRPTAVTGASTSASPPTTPTAPPRRCSTTSPMPGWFGAAGRANPVRLHR